MGKPRMTHTEAIELARAAMEQAVRQAAGRPLELVHIDVDFAGPLGDEARITTDVQKAGRIMAFAGAEISFGGVRIVRASAVFKINGSDTEN